MTQPEAGTVYVDVEPRAEQFWRRFREQTRADGTRTGGDLGRQIGSAIAVAIVKAIKEGLDSSTKGSPAKEPGRKSGEDFGGEFAATARRRIEAALKALPRAEIGVATGEAEQKLKDLRGDLAALGGKTIGVDISAADALAELDRIRVSLDRVGAESTDPQVRVDTAKAVAQLAAFSAEVDKVDRQRANVEVDVDSGAATAQLAAVGTASSLAVGDVNGLLSAGIALGPLIVPAAAAAAAAIGAIGPAALIGAGGIGVLALGLIPVISAVKAMGEAQDQAGKAASSSAGRQLQMASAIDQVRSAQSSLANTQANAAAANSRAAQQVANAERSLAQAQQEALRVQNAVNEAREEARRALESLNNQVTDNALAQRRAVLQVQDAQRALQAIQADPTASARQREEAQLAYDEAAQQLAELQQQHHNLAEDQAEAQKAGVDGSKQVVAAQDQVRAAQDRVAQAEQALTDARRQQADTARQQAFAVAQAQQAVVNAQRAVQQASISAGNSGSASADKLRQAMARLTPEGRAFATFLFGLKPAFDQLSGAAQAGFLPGLQAGMTALLPVLPQITGFVSVLAGAMGELFRRAGEALASPFWQQFFTTMQSVAVPLLSSFGSIVGGLARGFAGLLQAFAPFSAQFAQGVAGLAQRFGDLGTSVGQSAGFQQFIDYVTRNGPLIVSLLGNLAVITVKLAIALAPLAEMMLRAATALAQWLATLSPGQLELIAAGITGIGVALAIALDANPVGLIITAIVALVGAVVYAWTHFETFRTVVLAVVGAVQTAALFLWHNVLEPAFTGIAAVATWLWQNVLHPVFTALVFLWQNVLQPAALFLWHNVIEPAFVGITLAVRVFWALAQVVFGLFEIALHVVGAAVMWLWRNAIEPAFRAIGDVIGAVWRNGIKPIFDLLANTIRDHVAPSFSGGVSAIQAAWEKLRDAAKAPVRFVIDSIINAGIIDNYNKLVDFFHAGSKVAHVPLPPGFATGGYITGPGGPRDDAILARLSAGEYVIPAHVVAAYGVDWFDELIGSPGSRRPGDGSQGLAFKDGGLVGWLKSSWSNVTNPVGWFRDEVGGLLDAVPGAGELRDVTVGMGRSLLGNALTWIQGQVSGLFSSGGYKGEVPSDVASVQSFIRQQAGKPYVWASAGPEGYDCSGLVSAAWNMLHGRTPYSHTFSTANEAGYFPLPGWGLLTAGYAGPGQRGGGRVGHTAGNLAGLAFESRGGDGVVVGSGATPVTSFAHLGHYDEGGWLLPGLTIARNDTNKPEAIFTSEQLASFTGGQQPAPQVRVYIGNEEITSRVQVVVDRSLDQVAQQLSSGVRT